VLIVRQHGLFVSQRLQCRRLPASFQRGPGIFVSGMDEYVSLPADWGEILSRWKGRNGMLERNQNKNHPSRNEYIEIVAFLPRNCESIP
jgi:hypothetical protein